MEMVKITLGAAGLMCSLLLALPPLVWGHCDTLEGPVVVDAKAALAKGDITPILKWIPAKEEAEAQAQAKAREVRFVQALCCPQCCWSGDCFAPQTFDHPFDHTCVSRTKRAPAPPTYTHALNHTDTESKMHIGILEQAKRRPSIMFRV